MLKDKDNPHLLQCTGSPITVTLPCDMKVEIKRPWTLENYPTLGYQESILHVHITDAEGKKITGMAMLGMDEKDDLFTYAHDMCELQILMRLNALVPLRNVMNQLIAEYELEPGIAERAFAHLKADFPQLVNEHASECGEYEILEYTLEQFSRSPIMQSVRKALK